MRSTTLAIGAMSLLSACWADFPSELLDPDGSRHDTVAADTRVDLGDGPRLETATDAPRPDGPLPDLPPPDLPPPDLPWCPGSPCPLGCNGTTRCNRLLPSNDLGVNDTIFSAASKAWTVAASSATIDTDIGEISDGAAIIRQAGNKGTTQNGVYWNTKTQAGTSKELSVFVLASLTVPAGKTVTVVGSRALALYVTGSVDIGGTIQAAANGNTAGPGGHAGGDKESDGESCLGGEGKKGENNNSCESGGGGGGRKVAGGKGGDASSGPVAGGAGGGVVGGEDLVPLFGGCGGGGGGADSEGGEGGGGGGAIQIAANGSLTISTTGVITAAGAGGSADGQSGDGGGGGGGSGGAILLEAASITVNGMLAANGGGGGGADCGSNEGTDGEDGRTDAQSATGGSCVGSGCGKGGAGGALSPEAGAPAQDVSNCGGGGGGAAGRIRLNSSMPATIGSQNASPAPSVSAGSIGVW